MAQQVLSPQQQAALYQQQQYLIQQQQAQYLAQQQQQQQLQLQQLQQEKHKISSAVVIQNYAKKFPILAKMQSPKGQVELIETVGKGNYGYVYKVCK
jgi:hypothetical protein